ncbi:MAG: chorismate synthase [Oscillospiraceae bacterium]|nr:chorismate synthase [Oscillospiraceae bacterium]
MASSIGSNIRLTIFGQSHSAAIGMTLEGLPAGIKIDFDKLEAFTSRRAPGKNAYSTARKEADKPEFISGLRDGTTCGAPLTAIIRNTDTRSNDYSELKILPRPGHADFTASVKYGGYQDYAGGGHFSGRLTAPLCVAGGIVLQILESLGITVISRIASIGNVSDDGELLESTASKPFPTVSDESATKMQECIASAKSEGDSVGGIVECKVLGLPTGLGDPMFDGMENKIANIVFGIPAVKGIEFGIGFEASKLRGRENNDPFEVRDGKVVTTTNNCGGILGGITTGMPLVFRVAFKPTPSISQKQHSVRLDTLTEGELVVKGRHDPCIVPRAVPCVEAAATIAVYDAYLEYKKYL